MEIEYKFVKEEEIKEFKEKEWKIFNKENNYEYNEKMQSIAAYHNGKHIGFALFRVVGGAGYLKELIVRKDMRKNKIGSKLMDLYEDFCIEKGCHMLHLKTTPSIMNPAFELYKRKGFEVKGEIKDAEFHFDHVFMTKKLEVKQNDN